MNHDFYAHHSPFGANSSFTLGRYNKSGGFGLELGRPADQDIYIAYSRKGEKPRALPFYSGYIATVGNFTATDVGISNSEGIKAFEKWHAFNPEEIRRDMGWATDTWQAGDLTFRLLTPFTYVPDPATASADEVRLLVLPAILAEVELDNTASSKPAWAFFGIGTKTAGPLRLLSDTTAGRLRGVAHETKFGLAAVANGSRVEEVQTWDVVKTVVEGSVEQHQLVGQGGLMLRVAPGKKETFTIALGFYRGGIVTSGIETSYYYTRFYNNLEQVLATALEYSEKLKQIASRRDLELRRSGLSKERQFLVAHATHSYYGSSQLLADGSKPLWVVNEGEYQMINTFDLTVDHLFFEMKFHPWAVRNVLDLFVDRYRYYDQVQDVLNKRSIHPGGISFCHDMGVMNQFTRPQWSSYELADKPGCFSHMTQEQLVNWILCAATYFIETKDENWLQLRQSTCREVLDSLLSRDHHNPAKRTGIMHLDSTRCGKLGQEITTYDSLDTSLGQARNNLYLAVKTWAAYLGLEKILNALGFSDLAKTAAEQARKSAKTISEKIDRKQGFIPAVFDENNTSRIIPAIEGLAFLHVWGDFEAVSVNGPYGPLIKALKEHIQTVLVRGTCIDEKSGGWKMSSTSTNTWMSKIAISQFVVERVLGLKFKNAETSWDKAHVRWQQVGCADWAFTDQIRSYDGAPLGSKYYPRGVTSILWMRK